MAINIIIEDGSNVADANSYVGIASARAYAIDRGIVLSASDDIVAAQLIQAADYILFQEEKMKGCRSYDDQSLSYPRRGVYIGNVCVLFDAIPNILKMAQCQLVIVQSRDINLFPVIQASDYVIEKTVGPITKRFADPSKLSMVPTLPAVDALLFPLFGSIEMSLRTVRV